MQEKIYNTCHFLSQLIYILLPQREQSIFTPKKDRACMHLLSATAWVQFQSDTWCAKVAYSCGSHAYTSHLYLMALAASVQKWYTGKPWTPGILTVQAQLIAQDGFYVNWHWNISFKLLVSFLKGGPRDMQGEKMVAREKKREMLRMDALKAQSPTY